MGERTLIGQPAHALGWLAWIARNLSTGKDLRWWDIPRWVPGWRLRAARGLLAGLITWPVVTLLAWLTYRDTSRALAYGPPGVAVWAAPGLAAGLGAAMLAGLVIRIEGGTAAAPRRSLRQRLRILWPLLLAFMVSSVAGGIASAAVTEVTDPASTAPAEAEAFTQIVVFFSVIVVWWRRQSHHSRSEPVLETPVVRAVTGAFAAVCPVGVWGYLVEGFGERGRGHTA